MIITLYKGVGEGLCYVGYEGMLCSVCSSGYYYNSNSAECLQCHGTKVNSIKYLIVL